MTAAKARTAARVSRAFSGTRAFSGARAILGFQASSACRAAKATRPGTVAGSCRPLGPVTARAMLVVAALLGASAGPARAQTGPAAAPPATAASAAASSAAPSTASSPAAPAEAAPADWLVWSRDFTAQCVQRQGVQLLVRNGHPQRTLRVWLERWHMGRPTGDRSRSDLAPNAEPEALGCSRTDSGAQEWKPVRAVWLD